MPWNNQGAAAPGAAAEITVAARTRGDNVLRVVVAAEVRPPILTK